MSFSQWFEQQKVCSLSLIDLHCIVWPGHSRGFRAMRLTSHLCETWWSGIWLFPVESVGLWWSPVRMPRASIFSEAFWTTYLAGISSLAGICGNVCFDACNTASGNKTFLRLSMATKKTVSHFDTEKLCWSLAQMEFLGTRAPYLISAGHRRYETKGGTNRFSIAHESCLYLVGGICSYWRAIMQGAFFGLVVSIIETKTAGGFWKGYHVTVSECFDSCARWVLQNTNAFQYVRSNLGWSVLRHEWGNACCGRLSLCSLPTVRMFFVSWSQVLQKDFIYRRPYFQRERSRGTSTLDSKNYSVVRSSFLWSFGACFLPLWILSNALWDLRYKLFSHRRVVCRQIVNRCYTMCRRPCFHMPFS